MSGWESVNEALEGMYPGSFSPSGGQKGQERSDEAVRLPMRWHADHRSCPHYNEHACPTCDFDDYYADNYPDCPWGETAIAAAAAEAERNRCPACLRPFPHNLTESRACPNGGLSVGATHD